MQAGRKPTAMSTGSGDGTTEDAAVDALTPPSAIYPGVPPAAPSSRYDLQAGGLRRLWRRLLSRGRARLDAAVQALLDIAAQLQIRALGNFRSQAVTTAAGRLRVLCRDRRCGSSAPTWIFLHGFAGQASDWAPLLRRLAPLCGRILALDLPGHGRSQRALAGGLELNARTIEAAVAEALEQLLAPNERCVLVGNSMGCLVALRLAQRWRGRLAGAIFLAPLAPLAAPAAVATLQAKFQLQSWADALNFVDRLYLRRLWPARRWLAALVIRCHLRQPHLQALLAQLGQQALLTDADLRALPPTLLICGERDDFLPRTVLNFYAERLQRPQDRVIWDPDLGHVPFLEQADRLVELLHAWRHLPPLLLPAAVDVAASRRARSA